MLDRLDRAFASQRQFIAYASHELRTPLTVMRTSVDVVLAKPAPTPAELTGMAIEVRMAVDRAELLLDTLLTVARSSPPDQLDRLFLPFTRLDDRTRHDGFGLGLALVSSITAAHGGRVSAAAVPTGGLDVTVRLPRRASDVPNPSAPTDGARAVVNDDLGHNGARSAISPRSRPSA